MAKQVILLERLPGAQPIFRVALWAVVPAARQTFYADPAKKSAWKDAATGELAALQSGAVLERVERFSVEPGTTVAQIKAQLQARFTAFQAEVTGQTDWQRYGSFFDPAAGGWTDAGV